MNDRRLRQQIEADAADATTEADKRLYRAMLALWDAGRITPSEVSRLVEAVREGDTAATMAAWVLRLLAANAVVLELIEGTKA